MIPEQIKRFVDERDNDVFTDGSKKSKHIYTLTYYDTYTLLALTNRNIEFLNEKVLKELKPHKNKLYFKISFDKNYETFELTNIIFASPLSKCIRVVTAIKNILTEYSVGTHLNNVTGKNKKQYTIIQIIKVMKK